MLTVENLVAGYDGRAVARLPALRVEAGRTALLLGPSGSGKTTLLLGMAGLADVFSGSISLKGENLRSLSPRRLEKLRSRSIGLIFQDLHLIEGLSMLDNVLLAPYAAGEPQDRLRALSLLEELGLEDEVEQAAETLSRGQAQRVAIVRAMMMRPTLILADEPTASLDDASCARVSDLLNKAAAETGAALVIATHDLRLRGRTDQSVEAIPVSAAAPLGERRAA